MEIHRWPAKEDTDRRERDRESLPNRRSSSGSDWIGPWRTARQSAGSDAGRGQQRPQRPLSSPQFPFQFRFRPFGAAHRVGNALVSGIWCPQPQPPPQPLSEESWSNPARLWSQFGFTLEREQKCPRVSLRKQKKETPKPQNTNGKQIVNWIVPHIHIHIHFFASVVLQVPPPSYRRKKIYLSIGHLD